MRTAGPFRRRRGGASPTSSRPATPTEWLALWLLCFAYRLSGRRHRPGRGSGQPRRRSGGRDTQSSVGDVRGRPAAVVACHPASPRAAYARARLVSRDVPASRGPPRRDKHLQGRAARRTSAPAPPPPPLVRRGAERTPPRSGGALARRLPLATPRPRGRRVLFLISLESGLHKSMNKLRVAACALPRTPRLAQLASTTPPIDRPRAARRIFFQFFFPAPRTRVIGRPKSPITKSAAAARKPRRGSRQCTGGSGFPSGWRW